MENKMLKDGILSIGAKVIFFVVLKFLVEPWMNIRMGDAGFGHYVVLLGYISVFAYSCGEALNHIRVLNQESDEKRAAEYRIIIFTEAILSFLILVSYSIFYEKESLTESVFFGLAAVFMMLRLYSECMFRIEINYKRILISSIIMAGGYLVGYFFYTKGAPWYLIIVVGEASAVIYAAIEGKAFTALHKVSEAFSKTIKNAATLTSSYLISYILIYMDRFLVSFLLGEELVSTYYIATFYGKCVALIIPPITAVLLSNISKGIIPLDKKMVNKVVSASLGAIAFFFLAGIPASRIIIYLLYRSSYQAALPIMDIGNLGQIIYYSCSIVNMMAIRLCDMKLQVKVETTYAISYILFAFVGAKFYGLFGLAAGTLLANCLRFLMLTIPVYGALRKRGETF
jgi:O-antigen/teichoic acid export membrane protein